MAFMRRRARVIRRRRVPLSRRPIRYNFVRPTRRLPFVRRARRAVRIN